jgi:hypothetical protein
MPAQGTAIVGSMSEFSSPGDRPQLPPSSPELSGMVPRLAVSRDIPEPSQQLKDTAHPIIPPADRTAADVSNKPAVSPATPETSAPAHVPRAITLPRTATEISDRLQLVRQELQTSELAKPQQYQNELDMPPETDSQEMLQACVSYLQKTRSAQTHEEASPMTDRDRAIIKDAQRAILEVGAEDLGIDLTDNLLSLDKHHVYATRQDYDAAQARFGRGHNPGNGGTYNPITGLNWVRRDGKGLEKTIMTHEQAHAMSKVIFHGNVVTTTQEDGRLKSHIDPLKIGIAFGPKYSRALAEITADMVADYAAPRTSERTMIYTNAVIDAVGTAVINHTAKMLRIPPEEVARELMRESFGAGKSGTEMIEHALGSDRVEQFARISPNIDADAAADLVRSWELTTPPGTDESIRSAGMLGVDLFPWRPNQT